MITAIATNIIVDILEPDPAFGPNSKEALKKCLREGIVVACEIVWAEVLVAYEQSSSEVVGALQKMGIQFSPIDLNSCQLAALCWSRYLRSRRKKRTRIAADFLIGGHAIARSDRLLTRDTDFYKRYFRGLTVITPHPARI